MVPKIFIQTPEGGDRNATGLASADCKIIFLRTLTRGPQVLTGEAASQEDNGSHGSGTLPFGTKKEPHNMT